MKAAEALPDAIVLLRAAGVPDPVRDARLLLAFAAGWPTDRISLHLQDRLDARDLARFERAITARAARQPLSQITGQRLFFGRRFGVSPDVLDPRPETETLVLAALAHPSAGFWIWALAVGRSCCLCWQSVLMRWRWRWMFRLKRCRLPVRMLWHLVCRIGWNSCNRIGFLRFPTI